MLTKKSMDGKFVSIRFFFLVFQKFCIIQKGHFWNFINCPFSYIQKVWNGNLLAFLVVYYTTEKPQIVFSVSSGNFFVSSCFLKCYAVIFI